MKFVFNEVSLQFEFVNDFMVSTNDMYFHVAYKRKGSNRYTTHAVKSDELKKLQEICNDVFKDKISDEFIEECKKYLETGIYGLKIESVYYMPKKNYENSDVSNYIKAYEDCISVRMRGYRNKNKVLDDKNNIAYYSDKKCSMDDQWHVITKITVHPRDYYYRASLLGEKIPLDINELTHPNYIIDSNICPICGDELMVNCDNNLLKCKYCNAVFRHEEGDV